MSWASERASIEGRLNTNWTTTSIAYDNVDFDPPDNTAWVRLSILNGASGYRALEAKKRHTGVIVLQIFGPKNQGSNTLRGYADTLAGVFEDAIFDDVVCRAASVTPVAQAKEDSNRTEWYQLNVTIPYWRDET